MRQANMDRRLRLDKHVMDTMQAHGVCGLFIDPESALVCLSSSQSRISPRQGTAFHHTHLPEEDFETIAKSLAEGVGVTATARIQNVDKKTVLLVLAKEPAKNKFTFFAIIWCNSKGVKCHVVSL